jgi:hypothetical protein
MSIEYRWDRLLILVQQIERSMLMRVYELLGGWLEVGGDCFLGVLNHFRSRHVVRDTNTKARTKG